MIKDRSGNVPISEYVNVLINCIRLEEPIKVFQMDEFFERYGSPVDRLKFEMDLISNGWKLDKDLGIYQKEKKDD